MGTTASKMLPSLVCRKLPAYAADKLDAVRTAFRAADSCATRQAWLPKPESDFRPATVRTGWRENSLCVFAELEDVDIFTHATAHNQRMWESGDVFEIFLQPAGSPSYVELHVTPNNLRLQLSFPDTVTLRRAQAENVFDRLILPDGAFRSHTWLDPENGEWYVHAEIPPALVCGDDHLPAGGKWRFSFSRYDYSHGRHEPVISSTSPHTRPDFHRREEWGTLFFDGK
ncbi:MAG TPA: carbohydrate-binding family 9-like protein [Verrucomicrobiae bacterium]|jgi:hypothetical protein|nr:carbohydrate-binding family 9-like protein [Verrucomicrobiae bacterium]